MIALFAYWMIPAAISALLLIWVALAAARVPMNSNGVYALMVRLECAVLVAFIMWGLYGLFCLGVWLARLIGG